MCIRDRFCPAYVDPHNGYRYYSASQIDYLDTILIMKKIGFSLDEIKEHMLHYNIDSSLAALKRQVSVIDRQIQELRLIRNRVLHRCGQMEEATERRGNDGAVTIESQDADVYKRQGCKHWGKVQKCNLPVPFL